MLEKNININQFDLRLIFYHNHINFNQIQKNNLKDLINNLKNNKFYEITTLLFKKVLDIKKIIDLKVCVHINSIKIIILISIKSHL